MFASLNLSMLLAFYSAATSNIFITDLVMFFAEWFPYIVIGSVVLYEVFASDHEHEIIPSIIRTLLPALIAWFVVMLIKYVFPAGRPFTGDLGLVPLVSVSDPFGSFPSGHAAAFGALAGAMLGNKFHAWKWYLLAALLIALARVAAGVHWPVDVIAGLAFGFFVGFFVARPLQMIKRQAQKT